MLRPSVNLSVQKLLPNKKKITICSVKKSHRNLVLYWTLSLVAKTTARNIASDIISLLLLTYNAKKSLPLHDVTETTHNTIVDHSTMKTDYNRHVKAQLPLF